MENASKALLIAGGMLIGIIIVTLFAYEMMQIAETGREYQKQMALEEVTKFNAQFEKYENKKLSAQEVVTIYTYVTQRNIDLMESVEWTANDIKDVSGIIKLNINPNGAGALGIPDYIGTALYKLRNLYNDNRAVNNTKLDTASFLQIVWKTNDTSNIDDASIDAKNRYFKMTIDSYSPIDGRVNGITISVAK